MAKVTARNVSMCARRRLDAFTHRRMFVCAASASSMSCGKAAALRGRRRGRTLGQ
ncbi:hypothetical protein [Actinomyces bouchesdurhonensis]|uniref:hypothetical protein n=1 Tax=Actinomyces bouchesdurhonensis TaxID=1852361 RepID=UPI0023EFE74A|nr:hypothetical protein [Actinomyces bouchesdurhonensis]